MTAYIYLITNTANGKVYFGKAVDVERRWAGHCKEARAGCKFPLHRAIRKYGKKVFKVETLEEFESEARADEREVVLIASVSKRRRYNVAEGGTGGNTMSSAQLEAQWAIKPDRYEKFRRLFDQGASMPEVAQALGVSINAVKSCAQRLGLSFFTSYRERLWANPGRRKLREGRRPERERREKQRQAELEARGRRREERARRRAEKLRDRLEKGLPEDPLPRGSREYSAYRARVARRSNRARGVSEHVRSKILVLYLERGLSAREVADELKVSRGAVRATVNRLYASGAPKDRVRWKKRHLDSRRERERS